jgi:deoxyguanosine kinase
MPFIISIEGNIGSGKSTFIEFLRSEYDEREVVIVPEPVQEWDTICDTSGKRILEYFYEDQDRNAFSFQMMAYISRLASLKKAVEMNPHAKLIITERCLETDRNVFAKMLHKDGKIRDIDYQIYEKWFDEFVGSYTPSYYIYIRASATICAERIRMRSRKGEEDIPIGYLRECGNSHDSWLIGRKNVITCDGSVTKEKGHANWKTYIDHILSRNSVIQGTTLMNGLNYYI